MTVKELVTKYDKLKKQDEKLQVNKAGELIAKHIKITYMPYQDKIVQAKNVVAKSSYKDINGKSVFVLDTPGRYMMFILSIIEYYTDIEWEKTEIDGIEVNDVVGGFNLLEETGLVEVIINSIGADIERYKTVLDMVTDDTIDANRSIVPYLDTKFEAINMMMDTLEQFFTRPEVKDKVNELLNTKAD